MKKYQFEEITAALSVIICLLSWYFGVMWLFWIYLFKSVFDTIGAIWEAVKYVKKHPDK